VRTMLLFAALSLPTLALADAAPRQPPKDTRCQRAPSKKDTKTLEKWQPELGGDKTRKAWKELLGAGQEGCKLVAEWLAAGGAGEDLEGHRDAAHKLILFGDDAQVALGDDWLMGHDGDTTRHIAAALERRLALVDEEQAAYLGAHPDKGVRDDVLGLLMGYHSEGRMVSKRYGPVTVLEYEETLWLGAPEGPTPYVVAAVKSILDQGDHDTAEKVAKFGSRFYKERYPGHEAWADFTVDMVGVARGEKDFQKAANIAARLTAYGEGPRLGEMVEKVLAAGNDETLEHMLDGFEDGFNAGIATPVTLGHLQTIADSGSGKQHKRAAAIHKKASKKIG
jgi:hypothetical protein